jgi:hypothetical protein
MLGTAMALGPRDVHSKIIGREVGIRADAPSGEGAQSRLRHLQGGPIRGRLVERSDRRQSTANPDDWSLGEVGIRSVELRTTTDVRPTGRQLDR